MDSIIKENNKFRAYIYIKGERGSETFSTKKKAKSWAVVREAEMIK